jgi:uncharacterized protein YyaL (SSP411 family)
VVLQFCACSHDEGPSREDVEATCEVLESDTKPHDHGPGDPALPGITVIQPRLVEALEAARLAGGRSTTPRTAHLREDGTPLYDNRLLFETSPYLLQHAHNPVNWHPWGDEAFERARREGKPVFLSIGYSTCHWCHVMEHESFEDVEVAAFLNTHFIPVKVDREERPDVDEVYMTAVQMMTGSGGWPLTLLLTPDRQPFFGGTYFPARDGERGSRRGLLSILAELQAAWTGDRAALLSRGETLSRKIRGASETSLAGDLPGGSAIAEGAKKLLASFDSGFGGFGVAPKFPRPSAFELLLRASRRSGDGAAREAVAFSLATMAGAGIHDQVGGGFHRYATDRRWMVPHFEKMLYDNAALATLYLDAFQATGREDFADVVRDILDYVSREMTSPEGVFYSATDADSAAPDGTMEEGRFFTWTPGEVEEAVGPDLAPLAKRFFGLDEPVLLDGRAILHTPRSIDEEARRSGTSPVEVAGRIDTIRNRLREARAQRPAPLRDDKILTAWNAMMISAFARAAVVLGRDDYAEAAAKAASWIESRSRTNGGLRRTWIASRPGGSAHQPGEQAFLDDHAALVSAILDVFEATPKARWMDAALRLQESQDRLFLDRERGGYFATSEEHERLLARDKPSYDGPEPSGNATSAMNLLRLAEFTGNETFRIRAEATLKAFAGPLASGSVAMPKMLGALDFALDDVREVVIVADRQGDPALAPLLAVLRRTWLPNHVLVITTSPDERPSLQSFVPLLEDKVAKDGVATAYVCTRGTCKLPTSDPAVFAKQLAEVKPLIAAHSLDRESSPR